MRLLASIFPRRDRLTHLARSAGPQDFLKALAGADIHVLSVPFDPQLDPATMDEAEFLAMIETSVKDLAERETGFAPFTFERDGCRVLPFFSTQELLERFVKTYVNQVRKIIPFQVLTIQGIGLGNVRDAADRFVLNAETKYEHDCTTHMQLMFDAMNELDRQTGGEM